MLMAGALVFTGCNDNDYDFDQIDATVGIGGDGLEIPVSSTENIKLKDVLDLEKDGSVVEDASTHDYVFRQNGDPINPVVVNINKISVAKQHGESLPFTFNMPSAAKGHRRAYGSVTADADIYQFTYEGDKPTEVVELVSADASTTLSLNVPLHGISSAVSKLQTVEITLPDYITFVLANCSQTPTKVGSTLVFSDVPTSQNLKVNVNVTKLDFTKAGNEKNQIKVSGNKIHLKGTIHIKASGAITGTPTGTIEPVMADFTMADFTINAATGKFDPEINLNEGLGSARITGIPDFLQDENVKVDLYNPEILLTIGNDMEADGTIYGKIISKKNGAVINTINNVVIPVAGNTENKVCINRTGGAHTGYTVIAVPELSKAIETIPDEITFEAIAKANSNKQITFQLGHDYHITPAYSIDAPLAFAENAEIVYKDTLDGWNDDLEDLELADGTYISATAAVKNGIPAYLQVEAVPVGVAKADGTRDIVDGIKIEFPDGKNKVAASEDGSTVKESPLEIKITQTKEGALEKLDGIVFTASGTAKRDGAPTVTGITLNAEKHTLKLDDIKIKIVGKVIGDFN